MLLDRIKKSSVPQLLLRYLVEIIIIFLGITISFVFEQWREGKRQKKELVQLSESLLTDIDALKAKLALDLTGSADWISHLDSLRNERTSGNPSKRQLKWFFEMATGQYIFLFDPYSPTYMSAASTRLINELPDSLKNKLYDLYRVQLPFFQLLYNQQQENISNFKNNILVPSKVYLYQNDPLSISPDFNALAKELHQPLYGNLINQIIITEKIVYQRNEQTSATLTELQESLRKYIEVFEKQ